MINGTRLLNDALTLHPFPRALLTPNDIITIFCSSFKRFGKDLF